MVTILMMAAKMAPLGLLKIKVKVANKKILLGRSFIYLVASVNAAHHGWAAKKILRFRRSKTVYFSYKISKIINLISSKLFIVSTVKIKNFICL